MKFLLPLLFLTACSVLVTGKEGPKTAKGSRYSIAFSRPDWISKKEEKSDYVFENRKDGRILLSNSFCDEFQEQPLDQLARKTFKGIKDFSPKESKFTTFNDRESYRLTGSGHVDGVTVNVILLNTRRDNCYFDFLGISPKGTEKDDSSFSEFLKEVKFK
jgi:hypothetical protein